MAKRSKRFKRVCPGVWHWHASATETYSMGGVPGSYTVFWATTLRPMGAQHNPAFLGGYATREQAEAASVAHHARNNNERGLA